MRRLSSILLAIVCLAGAAGPAAAQGAYPNKLIRVLVPYAPSDLRN